MARMSIDGYGQVELNNVAFRRDGRIEAQCALDTADFASVPAENGMILRVKKAEHKIGFADASAKNQLYALNYSAEHFYDESKSGLKNFKLDKIKLLQVREEYIPFHIIPISHSSISHSSISHFPISHSHFT